MINNNLTLLYYFSAQKNLVSVDDAGRLVYANGHRCSTADCSCWILSVPLADDCHAYNCRLSLLAGGTVGLHTTTAVMPGQPLKMWFSPDLQLMLHVPFLTPVNIKGKLYDTPPRSRAESYALRAYISRSIYQKHKTYQRYKYISCNVRQLWFQKTSLTF